MIPSFTNLLSIFGSLGGMPSGPREVLLGLLDQEKMRQLALWSSAFAQNLNTIGGEVDEESIKIIDPLVSDDFFAVMGGTEFKGKKIHPDDLHAASNAMTKAIKAKNWMEAIRVGMALSGLLA